MKLKDPLEKSVVGDEFVYLDTSYFYVRRTPDNRIMAMSSDGAMLAIPDRETGFPEWPRPADVVVAMKVRTFFLRSRPLPDRVRAEARAEEPCSAEVFHRDRDGVLDRVDAGTDLRNLVVRAWDALDERQRPSLSEEPLRAWVRDHCDMKEAVAAYGRVPVASTLRTWIRTRGVENDRRPADMPSRRGKGTRSRKFPDLVVTLGRLHAVALRSSRRLVKVQYTRFKRDVAKANQGEKIVIGVDQLVYERPAQPMKPYGLTTFQDECRRARSMKTEEAARGPGARKQNFGGGGFSVEPVRYLEMAQQDDSPFSHYFLIDPHNRIPFGVPTVVITFEIFCSVAMGWDVSLESASTSTWMRALAHCGIPKPVPPHLQEEFPELEDLYGYIRGRVVYDNAVQNIGHAAEDAAGDLAQGIRIAGEGEPTHKQKVERALATIQGYMREVDGVGLDIPLMRRFGYDPRKHVAITVDTFRDLLDEAIQTYHTQKSAALGGRSPLQVWLEQRAIHGHDQARDVDQFLRSIGDVHKVKFSRTGFEIGDFKLRYTLGTEGNEQLLSDFAAAHGSAGHGTVEFEAKVKSYDTVELTSIFNPLTRRYVEVPCSLRRYSKGMPVWQHKKILDFMAMTAREFRTEEQIENAREAFTASLEAAMPDATNRQIKMLGSVLDAPNVRRFIGSDIVLKRVEPSANGMSNDAVLHDSRALTRGDAMKTTGRPKRGGANYKRAEKQAFAEQKALAELAARGAEQSGRRRLRSSGSPENTGGKAASARAEKKPVEPLKPGTFS